MAISLLVFCCPQFAPQLACTTDLANMTSYTKVVELIVDRFHIELQQAARNNGIACDRQDPQYDPDPHASPRKDGVQRLDSFGKPTLEGRVLPIRQQKQC